jgi:SH3-like domain-containing protein
MSPASSCNKRLKASALALLLGVASASAFALEYRSVTEAAVMYDAPSAKAKPLFVVLAGTPVEVVVSLDGWVKVRDVRGDLVWIEKKFLAESVQPGQPGQSGHKRTLIVRAERAQIRAAGDDKAALVFDAERDVILELADGTPGASAAVPEGWLKVKHRDGQSGFVRLTQVWGY